MLHVLAGSFFHFYDKITLDFGSCNFLLIKNTVQYYTNRFFVHKIATFPNNYFNNLTVAIYFLFPQVITHFYLTQKMCLVTYRVSFDSCSLKKMTHPRPTVMCAVLTAGLDSVSGLDGLGNIMPACAPDELSNLR